MGGDSVEGDSEYYELLEFRKIMKKYFLGILILISFIGHSQDNPKDFALSIEDFELKEGRMVIYNKPFLIKNGENKKSEVKITLGCPEADFKNFDIHKMVEMIIILNEKSINSVKNKYTFIPRIIKLSYLPDSKTWHSTIEYSAQNDYGAIKTGLNSATFSVNYELLHFNTF